MYVGSHAREYMCVCGEIIHFTHIYASKYVYMNACMPVCMCMHICHINVFV